MFVGLDKPLLRPLETAAGIHGDDGMSGAQLPEPAVRPTGNTRCRRCWTLPIRSRVSTSLVTPGPLSNIATALLIDPQLLTKFQHTYMMVGAADGIGNVNAVAGIQRVGGPGGGGAGFRRTRREDHDRLGCAGRTR